VPIDDLDQFIRSTYPICLRYLDQSPSSFGLNMSTVNSMRVSVIGCDRARPFANCSRTARADCDGYVQAQSRDERPRLSSRVKTILHVL